MDVDSKVDDYKLEDKILEFCDAKPTAELLVYFLDIINSKEASDKKKKEAYKQFNDLNKLCGHDKNGKTRDWNPSSRPPINKTNIKSPIPDNYKKTISQIRIMLSKRRKSNEDIVSMMSGLSFGDKTGKTSKRNGGTKKRKKMKKMKKRKYKRTRKYKHS
jgi:hypothetical protein